MPKPWKLLGEKADGSTLQGQKEASKENPQPDDHSHFSEQSRRGNHLYP
jgi:hypothetical protein